MSGWGFAVSRRWAGYLALVLVFAATCSGLGLWQLARRAEARVEISRIENNYDAKAVPLATALQTMTTFEENQEWTPVSVTGTYLIDHQLLVRNRPYNGQPGFEVLTPLQLADGTVFVVDRGWIPTGSRQDSPDSIPVAPTGTVTVTARLKAGEPTLASRTTVAGSQQIPTINLPQIADTLDGASTYTAAYGLVASETPAPKVVPAQSLRPLIDEGPHLSYAFQWFVFGLMSFVGLGWALIQEYRLVNADDPEERERAAERHRKRDAREPSDSEAEDAMIEELQRH